MLPVIQLQSGKYIDLTRPTPDDISIEDIAHALSMQCRYTGHTDRFYSVAEHSYWCSYYAESGWELAALLHDAGEAYLGDIASPLKQLFPLYKDMETNMQLAVEEKFDIALGQLSSPQVKKVDLEMLKTEVMHLMKNANPEYWGILQGVNRLSLSDRQMGMEPAKAKDFFLARFYELTQLQEGHGAG